MTDTSTTGSRLPAEMAFAGAPTGIGLTPDLLMVAGLSTGTVPPRPEFARSNDASFDHGIIAQGDETGKINTERKIPWL